jgi:hypothetical protein
MESDVDESTSLPLGGTTMIKTKTLLLAGTAVLFAGAANAADMPAYPVEAPAVVAANPWDAYVSVGAGYSFFDVGDDLGLGGIGGGDDLDFDDFQAEVRASAAYQFGGSFGMQGDVVFNYQSFDFPEILPGLDILDSVKTTDVAGHAFWRNDSFLLGAFGQYGLTSADVIGPLGVDFDRFYGGAEAQAYFGNFTLYAQAGYQNLDLGIDIPGLDDVDGFFVNAEARYFATENWKLFVKGGYNTATISADLGGADFELDFDTFTVGGGTEYRFADSPLSVFANAEYSHSETDGLSDLSGGAIDEGEFGTVKVLAGLKLNLGSQTLLERDRAGASLDPVKDTLFNNLGAGISGILGAAPIPTIGD